MGLSIGGSPRVPVMNGTAAAMAAYGSPVAGDLWYTTDTLELYTYTGAAWTDVLSEVAVDLISETTVTSTPTSITLSSIPTGYKDFILELVTSPSGNSSLYVWFNNDTTNGNYRYSDFGNNSSTNTFAANSSGGTTKIAMAGNWGNLKASNENGIIMHIQNSSTKYKFVHAQIMQWGDYRNGCSGGGYNQTTEISRIDLDLGGANTFGNPTLVRLYGFK